MKRKVLLKASTFQKVENTRGVDIKGALNLNKEVLDTLVDKDVLGTTNCCQYYLTSTTVLEDEFESLLNAGAFPPNSFISVVDINGTLSHLAFVYLNAGVLEYAYVGLTV